MKETVKGTTRHYVGVIGNFHYNDEDFEVKEDACGEYLHYIGNETDGSKIKIPPGIENTRFMFAGNNNLESCPDMPWTVRSANGMYMNCTKITKSTNYSKRITSIVSIHEGCTSLVDVEKIADSVIIADNAFKGCTSMIKCMLSLPAELKSAVSMFEDCTNLSQPPKIKDKIEFTDRMFANCLGLKTCPQLHAKCKSVNDMYLNCNQLRTVPSIPLEARRAILGIGDDVPVMITIKKTRKWNPNKKPKPGKKGKKK